MVFSTELDVPKEPSIFLPSNISLHVIFSRHARREDLGDFDEYRSKIRSADIVIPEEFSWTEGYLKELQAIARGDSELYKGHKEKLKGTVYEGASVARLEALFASHKKILFVDVERGSDLAKKLQESAHGTPFADVIKPTWEETLDSEDNKMRIEADLQKQREDYILSQLGPKLEKAVQANPKLRQKKKVNVVMTIGTEHTRIAEELEANVRPGEEGLPSVSHEQLFKDSIKEVQLKNAYKSGRKLGEDEKKRLLAEIFVKSVLMGMDRSEGYLTDSLIFEEIVSSLTMEELQEVYDSIDGKNSRIAGNTPIMLKIAKQKVELLDVPK